jgi:hypothetical protein
LEAYERRQRTALPPAQILGFEEQLPMRHLRILLGVLVLPLVLASVGPVPAAANGDISKVKHIIVIMQENHSFDNCFGALAYAPGSPYHPARAAVAPTTTLAWTASPAQ